MEYNDFITRNSGYIAHDIQQKISSSTVLIAGCGMGSYTAEALIRLGCLNFILVDHDVVEAHNLNRQDYIANDIGTAKSTALAQRLSLINPLANIQVISDYIGYNNAERIVKMADIIVDTIDFLSIDGLMSLHEQCYQQQKNVISCMNAGWGALAVFIPAKSQGQHWIKTIFGLNDENTQSYSFYFAKLIARLRPQLPEKVAQDLAKIMLKMEEGKPCPASQIVAGSMAAASLVCTIVYRMLNNDYVVTTPHAMLLDMEKITQYPAVELLS